jgi:hypothetical protein
MEEVCACRYHLYIGNACPWCHRVLLAIAVLGLEDFVTYTWLLDDAERSSRGGWVFDASTGLDPVYGAADLRYVLLFEMLQDHCDQLGYCTEQHFSVRESHCLLRHRLCPEEHNKKICQLKH